MEQSNETTYRVSMNRDSGMHAVLPSIARLMRGDVLLLLLIFAVMHYFKLSTFVIAIDDEFEALRTDGFNWILTGRWASYLFLRYLVPHPVLPFLPTFLFGLGLAFSYPLLLSCFDVKRLAPVHYLAFPIYAGFPTWMFLTSLTTASCWAGVAQLVVVIAINRFRCALDALDAPLDARSKAAVVTNVSLSILALSVAMGFYQAFLITYVVLGLGVLLSSQQRVSLRFWKLSRHVLLLGALAVAGIVLHALVDIAFRRAFGLGDMRYIENFINLRALIDTPLVVIRQTLHSLFDVYAGRVDVYTLDCVTFPLIILTGLAAIAFRRADTIGGRLLPFLIAIGILCVPFAQHLSSGGGMPVRTYVAIPSVFWLFAMLGLTSRVRSIALTAFAAATLGMIQIIYASNLYFAAGYFVRIHDQELASAVYARIAELNSTPDSQKPYTVDFFGAHPFASTFPRPYSSTIGFSFFEWDGGNEERILDFMRLIGYDHLRAASMDQRRQDLTAFEQMPIWPARDSVRVVGDVTLIKLGPTAGFPFNAP
jgi:Glucosyl transferase GtrII